MTAGTATVTSKGQITLPKAIRDALGIQTGDVVIFERTAGGVRVRKAARASLLEFILNNPLPGPSMLESLKKIRDEWD
jgi:AbrB family looped-hinge helix DNA binding protein